MKSLFSNTAGTRETISTKPIRVYLIARIAPDAHARNKKIADVLGSGFEVFLPHEHNPFNQAHETFQQEVFDTDRIAMLHADLGLALVPFGRDCSWEVGWFSNSSKPVVAYVDFDRGWLRDWMIKGGVTHVATSSPRMFDLLQQDPILAAKCSFTPTPASLAQVLVKYAPRREPRTTPEFRHTETSPARWYMPAGEDQKSPRR